MNINIKATNLELTPAIRAYIEEKVGGLEKFTPTLDYNALDGKEPIQAWVEVGMPSKHHQAGDIFRAEIQIRVPHVEKSLRTESSQENLYTAIDEARNQMKRELTKTKEKKRSFIRKGSRLFKKIIPFLNNNDNE